MTGIREFVRDDIEQVADLHRDVMDTGAALTPLLLSQYRHWLSSVFLDSPMRTAGLESLVFEDNGEIVGFIGVVARQLTIGGGTFVGSAASNFCIRANRRGKTGIQMAREYLARSPDLALIDELTDRTRGVWDLLGFVAMPQSVRWTLPLRPVHHVLSLTHQHLPPWLNAAAGPPARLLDRAASRIPRSPFRQQPPDVIAEDLTEASLTQLLMEFGAGNYLRPAADGSTPWLVRRARSMKRFGDLQMVALRSPDGRVAGWYVYYARTGPSEVLQAVALSTAADKVLAHLAHHAHARGVVSLTGTLDRTFLSALSERWAMISPAPMVTRWRFVASRRPDVLEAFWRDRVLLSRLDGEWCQQFDKASATTAGEASTH